MLSPSSEMENVINFVNKKPEKKRRLKSCYNPTDMTWSLSCPERSPRHPPPLSQCLYSTHPPLGCIPQTEQLPISTSLLCLTCFQPISASEAINGACCQGHTVALSLTQNSIICLQCQSISHVPASLLQAQQVRSSSGFCTYYVV